MSRNLMILLVLLVLALAACGDDVALPGGGAGADGAADTIGLGDTTGLDSSGTDAPQWAGDVKDVIGKPDIGAGDTDSGGVAICPEAGGWMCECDTGADCLSGYCIDTPEGRRCTQTCEESCPSDDFACRLVSNTPPDVVYLCVAAFMNLCRPCNEHADCSGFDVGDDRCISYGDAGSFCGAACDDDGDCPSGYACDPDATAERAQCVPKSGECTCSTVAAQKQYSTACAVTNEYGSCSGVRKCSPDGLSDCDATPPAPEACNGQDDDCDGQTDEDDEGIGGADCTVDNANGSCAGTTVCQGGKESCDAATPDKEVCDGKDNDCDGETDEGFPDTDGDGDKDCVETDKDGDTIPDVQDNCPSVPNTDQTNTDGDNDGDACDTDDDGDGDLDTTDCAPLDPAIGKGATEACNGQDDDCDGEVDEAGATGCTDLLRDEDEDGYGKSSDGQCLCAPAAPYTASEGGDCDDANEAVNPGVTEQCNDLDDDCDGQKDEQDADGCIEWFRDVDEDGFGVDGDSKCLCAKGNPYSALVGGDCNDLAKSESPAVVEACNGKDDDCDGQIDEQDADGCQTYYLDADADGWGLSNDSQCLCKKAAPYTATAGGDCDDASTGVGPGGSESCNGVDDDCDGVVDEAGAAGCSTFFLDADADGFGKPGDSQCRCEAGGGYTAAAGDDCNDGAKTINPSAAEDCNGVDDDCDGIVDEADASGCTALYRDLDADGWGLLTDAKCLCAPQGLYTTALAGDCNDSDPKVSPGAAEVCGGGDENCNGASNEAGAGGCQVFYKDGDGDTFGLDADSACLCVASGGYTASKGGDCDDAAGAVNPSATEACNGLDDNCAGGIDEGCDDDGDDYCDAQMTTTGTPTVCPKGGGDCNDSDGAIRPGATEICNGVNDDCAGGTDDGCDDDGDDYCDADMTVVGTPPTCPNGGGDCNDAALGTRPGAPDAPDAAGTDTNCDGVDGTESAALFVDGAGGADGNPGTKASPKKTIGAAITAAGGAKTHVYVSKGTYTETVSLKNGVSVYGGFDRSSKWAHSPMSPTTITWSTVASGRIVAVNAISISAPTTLAFFTIQSGDNSTVGGSSYAVYAKDGSGLALTACTIKAGKGGNGAPGSGGGTGSNGGNGATGGNGTSNGSGGGGGGSGGASACAPGGKGGSGGYNKDGGITGDQGSNSGGAGGPGATGGNDCDDDGSGGGTGSLVGKGNDGSGGGSTGSVVSDYWKGDDGTGGVSGLNGRGGGGGGGGAGGSSCASCFACDLLLGCVCNADRGGGGGGGGGGGCGGGGGAAGKAAGGSFGVFLVGGSPTISGCAITTAGGGTGGAGGSGGGGGTAGNGMGGGSGPDDSGNGGSGGPGSPGGAGGGGGGGAGGVSYGIYRTGGASPTISGVDYGVAPGGAGGAGGAGNANKGAQGASGALH